MDFEDDVFDDVFEDDRYDSQGPDRDEKMLMEQLEHEQSLISRKLETNAFSVDRTFVNSIEYHRLFDNLEMLQISKPVREGLYRETGRLLEFVDGQESERMIAVNARTGDLVVDNITRLGSGTISGTGFNEKEYALVQNCKDDVIIIHNQSLNVRPSFKDLTTFLDEPKVKFSIIACHDGDIYVVSDVSPKILEEYENYFQEVKTYISDVKTAQSLTLSHIYQKNETLTEKEKLIKFKHLRKEL